MQRTVICISHETGARGSELGRLLAERLGYRYYDEDILVRAAGREGLSVTELQSVERRQSFLSRITESLATSAGSLYDPAMGPVPMAPTVTRDDLLALIRRTITEIAEEGDAVVVAHAASHALTGQNDVLRVLVVGTPESRAAHVAEVRGLDEREAARVVAENDEARAAYLKRGYSVKRELPTQYDLVVNTDCLEMSTIVDLVCAASQGG